MREGNASAAGGNKFSRLLLRELKDKNLNYAGDETDLVITS